MDPYDSDYANPNKSIDDLEEGEPIVVVYGEKASIYEFVQTGFFRWATRKFSSDYVMVRMGQPYRRSVVPRDRCAPAKSTSQLEAELGTKPTLDGRGGFA